MPDKDLKERTKKFALKIIKRIASPPRTREADIIGIHSNRQTVKIIFPHSEFRIYERRSD